ncbi:MAG: hypothetical protein Q8N45_04370, partial [Anaerolineales bacterium]|nr:hypothetical protein [Anaerolineales bacterium]
HPHESLVVVWTCAEPAVSHRRAAVACGTNGVEAYASLGYPSTSSGYRSTNELQRRNPERICENLY